MIGQGTIQNRRLTRCDLAPSIAYQAVPNAGNAACSDTRDEHAQAAFGESAAARDGGYPMNSGQAITFALDPQAIISKLADVAFQQTDADQVSILLPTGRRTNSMWPGAW